MTVSMTGSHMDDRFWFSDVISFTQDTDDRFWSPIAFSFEQSKDFHLPGKHVQQRHAGGRGRKIGRLRDIKSWERKNFRDWDESLSDDELKSIAGYFLPDLTKIQAAAREKGIGNEFLDSAIARAIIPEDIIVFRGLGTSKYKDRSLLGSIIEDKGYASTSLQRSEAGQYTGAGEGTEGILLEILIPKNTKAAPISMLPHRPDARKFGFDAPIGGEFSELVLPRNSRLKILSEKLKEINSDVILFDSKADTFQLKPIRRTIRNLTSLLLPQD